MKCPTPMQKPGRDDTFKVLCGDFKLSEDVRDALLATGMADLEEFRFWFTTEDECKPFLDKRDALPQLDLMATRLRRCWHAVRQRHKVIRE